MGPPFSNDVTRAVEARDHERLAGLAAALRDTPDIAPDPYLTVAEAMRAIGRLAEAEAVAAETLARFEGSERAWRVAASIAEAAGDTVLAASRAMEICLRFSPNAQDYLSALRLAHKAGRPAAVQEVCAKAVEAFPRHASILRLAARIATQNGQWRAADGHWQTVVALQPDDAVAARMAASAYIGPKLGRKQRWPEVLARFDALQARFPGDADTCVAHLDALRGAAAWDEAERKGAAWSARFPSHAGLALARARVAEAREDFAAAALILADARAVLPPNAAIEAAAVQVLSRLDRTEEAEAICAGALEKFPADIGVRLQHAMLATRQGEWTEALRRLQEAQEMAPGNAAIRGQIVTVRGMVTSEELLAAVGPASPAGAAREDALLSRFESLGGTVGGCEFGMVQRRFGAEPLGLLRWASIGLDQLARALRQDFDGVGEAEHTYLSTRRGNADRLEYWLQDRRFGITQHTFLHAHEAKPDTVLAQSLRRLRFLRGKLLEDLREAQKIFVFKLADTVDDDALCTLHSALRRHGRVTLLCVMPADPHSVHGSIRRVRTGLTVGHIGHFMHANATEGAGIDAATWRAFAVDAAAQHDRMQAA